MVLLVMVENLLSVCQEAMSKPNEDSLLRKLFIIAQFVALIIVRNVLTIIKMRTITFYRKSSLNKLLTNMVEVGFVIQLICLEVVSIKTLHSYLKMTIPFYTMTMNVILIYVWTAEVNTKQMITD